MIIYTDGAASNNQSVHGREGAWAFAVLGPPHTVVSRYEGNATNNQMELKAVGGAIAWAFERGYKGDLVVRTDSTYVIGAFSGNKIKANAEIIGQIAGAARAAGIRLVFEHVKGHAGDALNEACDEAARKAIRDRVPHPVQIQIP